MADLSLSHYEVLARYHPVVRGPACVPRRSIFGAAHQGRLRRRGDAALLHLWYLRYTWKA